MVSKMEQQPGLGDIARAFFKIGAMSYGGPAIMGIMQVEIQEKRQWIGKEKFVEGLALVNLLPGPLATQLAIFLGHETGGIAGGVVAGICFIVPAFAIMLVLSSLYVTFGTLPSLQNAFYGIGPVVIGIFAVAVYRLGKNAIKEYSQIAIAVVVAAIMLWTPAGLAGTLLAAGCAGLVSWRVGLISFLVLVAAFVAFYLAAGSIGDLQPPAAAAGTGPGAASLGPMGIFFLKVGAFTFGGGFTMLAFIEEQVVNQFGWLTQREFVDGLALGQLTPGPVLSLAAFVGYKLFGTLGAAVAITMIKPKRSLPVMAACALCLVGAMAAARAEDAPKENKGQKAADLCAVELGAETEQGQVRRVRLRLITLEPGGVAAVHSHEYRPTIFHVLEGKVTSHWAGQPSKILGPGDCASEGRDITYHWMENDGTEPVKYLSIDVPLK